MASQHLFKLSQTKLFEKTSGGVRLKASKANFKALDGMSFYKLILEGYGIREPHWHANADELGYCLKGELLINIYNTGDERATFLVKEGDAFLIPSGALHHIENTTSEKAEVIFTFSNDSVEDFNLSSTLGTFSNAVLGNTWGVKDSLFSEIKRSPEKTTFACLKKSITPVPEYAKYQSPFRYSLDSSNPILSNEGGSAKMARENVWPAAKNLALYSLLLTDKGMREPHWHPETAELGYVHKGKGRMSILNPSGAVDTYTMEEGDIYFIPKAYPHHIENLGSSLHLLIFFNQGMPKDIGFTGSVRSYSNEVLASVMDAPPSFFDQLEKDYADLFIVKKINPI